MGCCDSSDSTTIDFSCLLYTGAPLSCSGISTNDDGETIIQKLDTAICSATGDYSTYSMNCLPSYWTSAILNEATFVEAITSYACFINTTLTNYISSNNTALVTINNSITGITNPNITCESAGITTVDDFSDILEKYCTKFGEIDDAISLSSVIWNGCFTVPSPPTTIGAGFQLLADQICSLSSTSTALPFFNNIGSCLPTPGSNDSLVDTINKIKTRLCQSPVYDANNITWGCVTDPSSSSSIEEGLQAIITKVGQLSQAAPTFNSGDFDVVATDPSDACAGVTISLVTPINQDRLFALSVGDTSPGVWNSKVIEGTNITFDYVSTPGSVIINSTGGGGGTYQVKANIVDDSPGFLDEKINGGGSSGISIAPSYNPTTKQIDLMVSIDKGVLFSGLLDQLDDDAALYSKFCEKARNCPSPCASPTNVQAIAVGPTTTTTSTTTTTATP